MKYILFLYIFFSFSICCVAQSNKKPVTWDVTYAATSANEGEIIYTATIDNNWHIYSQRPTDVGPIPTSFSVTPNAQIELIGKTQEGQAHEEYVSAFDAKVFVFTDKAVFKQKIKRKNKETLTIHTSLEYMTCNDKQCLPPTTLEFDVVIPPSSK